MITVFISHSAVGDDVARSVCEAIEHDLKTNHYDVYYDARHEPGQRWRSTVYRCLADCHAAIVVITPKALASAWVKREVDILLWRYALGVPVTIIPALIRGATPQDVKDAGFDELMEFQDAQCADVDDHVAAAAEVVRQVVALFPKQPFDDESPMVNWLRRIASHIKAVKDVTALRQAGRALMMVDEDVAVLEPETGSSALAHQFLTPSEFRQAGCRAVHEFADFMPYENLQRLAALIAPTWVDGESARLLAVAKGGDRARVVLLNTTSVATVKDYIDRAFCCSVDGYRVAEAGIVVGEHVTRELLASCASAAKALARVPEGQELVSYLARWGTPSAGRVRCFLIVDPCSYFDRMDVIGNAVRIASIRYPWLTIVLLTGGVQVPPDKWGIERAVALPELDEDLEKEGYDMTRDLDALLERVKPGGRS